MKSDVWAKSNADRRAFIGGSDARIIMGEDETALHRLWREKRGEVEPKDLSGNLIVQLGTVTEQLNRRWYERAIPARSSQRCKLLQRGDERTWWQQVNLDPLPVAQRLGSIREATPEIRFEELVRNADMAPLGNCSRDNQNGVSDLATARRRGYHNTVGSLCIDGGSDRPLSDSIFWIPDGQCELQIGDSDSLGQMA